jgi:hypothetical protein
MFNYKDEYHSIIDPAATQFYEGLSSTSDFIFKTHVNVMVSSVIDYFKSLRYNILWYDSYNKKVILPVNIPRHFIKCASCGKLYISGSKIKHDKMQYHIQMKTLKDMVSFELGSISDVSFGLDNMLKMLKKMIK